VFLDLTTFVQLLINAHREPLLELGRTKAGELEQKQLINIANAAAKTSTLQHYIFSGLPHAAEISKGQLKVPHFDFKAEVEDYIKQKLPELAEKTTYLWCGWYASNMAGSMKPLEVVGSYSSSSHFLSFQFILTAMT
jgi:hypothetical protein